MITIIKKYAFFGCVSLTEITIPTSLSIIDDFAFFGCKSLHRIQLPPTLRSIGHSAFKGCSKLTKITIPPSCISIGGYCFEGCSSLKKISIHSNLNEIGDYMFCVCSSLKEFSTPPTVTRIGCHSFEECIKLNKIEISNSVNQIGSFCFSGCKSLKKLDIPNSVVSIGESFASRCYSLEEANIPQNVAQIKNCSFKDCISLKTVTIPPSVQIIGHEVFKGCSSLNNDSNTPNLSSIEFHNRFSNMKIIDDGNMKILKNNKSKDKKRHQTYFAVRFQESNFNKEFNRSIIETCLNHNSIAKVKGASVHQIKHKFEIILHKNTHRMKSIFDLLCDESLNDTLNNTDKQIILIGIASVYKYLHELNIIRPNITASNVLLDCHLRPKIKEFDIAAFEDELDDNNIHGIGPYVAPECFRDLIHNKKSDVYSFAIFMYEVLTGSRAFDTLSIHHIVYMVCVTNRRPSFAEPIKDSFHSLIQRCWDSDPNNRPIFNEIFDQLAYNENCYLDGVDVDKIKKYIDEMT